MRRRFWLFRTIALLAFSVTYFYFYVQLILPLGASPGLRLALCLALATPFASMLWLLLVYFARDDLEETAWVQRAVRLAHLSAAAMSFLLLCTIARDLLFWLPPLKSALAPQIQILGVLGAAAGCFFAGSANAARPKLLEVEVPIANLPAELEGYRIAQVSDLHIGNSIGKSYTQEVVEQLRQLKPRLIAITGDLVDGEPSALAERTSPLGQLRADDGVYYVTGNHEYYWGAEPWLEEVRRLGMRPLVNEHRVITVGSAKLVVAGIPDAWVSQQFSGVKADVRAAIAGAPDGAFKILLSHQPRVAFEAAEAGYQLQLSGHTHGGQFIPWTFVVRLVHPFVRGLYRVRDLWLYVSCGTGFWGPPMRLGTTPELTTLTLRGKVSQGAPA